MANERQYAILFAGVNGSLLAQEQNLTIQRANNAQPVSTVALGYAGDSPGAGMVHITVEGALPVDGFEFDAGPTIGSVTAAEVYTYIGTSLQLKCSAFIYEDTVKHGVNQQATYSFMMRAPLEQWEAGIAPPAAGV